MRPKGLLIAVVLLAVLGGLIFWSNKKQAASPPKSATDTTTKLLTISDDQFQEVRIRKLTGEIEDLKRENGKWRLVEPKPLAAAQDTVGSIVTTLGALTADKTIETNATDLAPYGLNTPTLDITITKKDGKTAEALVGDSTPTNSGAYAKLAGDPRVFTVASYVKTSLDQRDRKSTRLNS